MEEMGLLLLEPVMIEDQLEQVSLGYEGVVVVEWSRSLRGARASGNIRAQSHGVVSLASGSSSAFTDILLSVNASFRYK